MRTLLGVGGALFVVIAIVTGCAPRPGSGSGSGEFDRRAETICSEGNDAIVAIGPMPALGGRGASAHMFSLATVQARTARRLAGLVVSGDDHRAASQFVARLEFLVGKSREYGAQIHAGEVSHDGDMREAAVDAQNVALDLGLNECAHFGLP